MHEIKLVRLYEVWMPLKAEFRTSFGATSLRPAILVEVVDEEGLSGWGEVVAGEGPWYSYETVWTAWHVIVDFLSKMLPGTADPGEFYERAKRVRGHNMAKAGIEMALWDLRARQEGVPLYRLIGGVRDQVSVGVSVGIKGSVEELLAAISGYLEAGYGRVKIKIKPGWDVGVVERVRREYPDLPLQVDANAAYTLLDAPHLKKLDDYDLLMIEQPFHYDDLLEHSDFQRMIKTPVCLDESIKSRREAVAALRLDSAKIINIKPGRVGGIIESLKIHEVWSMEAHRPVWIGGMLETGVGRGHLVALATLPGVRYPSDISASSRYYEEDIVDEPWELDGDSQIRVREKPGIGVDVDLERLQKYVKRTTTIKPETISNATSS